MLNTFGCSKNALRTRLINYYQYNLFIDNCDAKKIVFNFGKGNVKQFFTLFENHKSIEHLAAMQLQYESYC